MGCGYVADFYFASLENHPQLILQGVYDEDSSRNNAFSHYYGVRCYQNLASLLDDDAVDIVVNLTNPVRHYEVSKAALESGKHVYSEKPLGWELRECEQLRRLAVDRGLRIAAAPCSILGEAAQTAWKLVREGALGKIRLVFAELNDGFLLNHDFTEWRMPSGAPWPYRDELETGCTLEHSAYYVSWLVAMFGNVKEVTAFATELIPEKVELHNLRMASPDFSVGMLMFESGIVARLTNSILAPRDRSLKIIGDKGTLIVDDAWDYGSPIWLTDSIGENGERVNLSQSFSASYLHSGSRMDFSRGIAELANSIEEDRPCRLSTDFAIHVDEICHAISSAGTSAVTHSINSRCAPMKPMDWSILANQPSLG